jgi:hypothetical protein
VVLGFVTCWDEQNPWKEPFCDGRAWTADVRNEAYGRRLAFGLTSSIYRTNYPRMIPMAR